MESLLRPLLQPFLDTNTKFLDADFAIYGVPLEATTSFRGGTRFAPQEIRRVSWYMETYSQRTDLDSDDVLIADLGDIRDLEEVEDSLNKIEEVTKIVHGSGKVPVIIGGEHTVTLGAIRALNPDLVLDFDAHLDLRHELMGRKMSHATFMRRALEEFDFKLILLGSRSMSREELEFVESNSDRVSFISSADLDSFERKDISSLKWIEEASSLYVSIDMDVIDPSYAPAVGNPSPEGIKVSQILDFVDKIADFKILGFDLTEVSPYYDSGLTSIQAAYIILENIYIIESSRRT